MESNQATLQIQGSLSKYSYKNDKYDLIEKNSKLVLQKMENFSYRISAKDQNDADITKIDLKKEPVFNYQLIENEKIFMWIDSEDKDYSAWRMTLNGKDSEKDIRNLQSQLGMAIYEINFRKQFQISEDDDKNYIFSQVAGGNKEDVVMEEVNKIQQFGFIDQEDDHFYQKDAHDFQTLLQGIKINRQFATSGPVVKVYKWDDDKNKLQNISDFSEFLDKEKQIINPENIMLFNGENQLVFTDQRNNNIYDYDMETGKIVSEYQAAKDQNILSISNNKKNGQIEKEDTYLAISEKGIFRIDTRLGGDYKQAQQHIYKGDTKFNHLTTTSQGQYVVSSQNGDIRLYNQVGQNYDATTQFPGLGNPISSVDTSIDGKWILATTQTCIILVSSQFSNGRNGFERAKAGQKCDKPFPIILQLSIQDIIKLKLEQVYFTSAKFNNFDEDNKEHTSIITSRGNYLITWNFKKVLKGLLSSYKISPKQDNVLLDSQFQFNKDDYIMFVQPNKIAVQPLKKI